MNIAALRALAAYHAATAANAVSAANGMGDCPVGRDFLTNAQRHTDWAEQLTELADAFETFGHVLGQPSAPAETENSKT